MGLNAAFHNGQFRNLSMLRLGSVILILIVCITISGYEAATDTAIDTLSDMCKATSQITTSNLISADFYSSTCPQLHNIVDETVAYHVMKEPGSTAPLVRLFFHDCFVQGCDASVLLNPTGQFNFVEKQSTPNLSLRSFHIIDHIKRTVETACPGVVSCADILALAARAAIVEGGGPQWKVELGRRDSRTSFGFLAMLNLPLEQFNIQGLIMSFATKGLDVRDLVALSGAHSFGQAHCIQPTNRLFGFNTTTGIDPTMNSQYGRTLQSLCGNILKNVSKTARVHLDQKTPGSFDSSYFKNLLSGEVFLHTDAALGEDNRTRHLVREFAENPEGFFNHFAASMIKMGRIGVLFGTLGEVRKNCSAVN